MKKLLENSVKKSCKRPIKKNSELKKRSTQNVTSCTSDGKVMRIHSIAGLI